MIIQGLIYAALFIMSILLQSTLLNHFQVTGIKPDIILVLVILLSIFKGKNFGAGIGFVYGLLEDLIIGKYIGLQALTKMAVGYIIGQLGEEIFKDNLVTPLLVAFIGSIISGTVQYAVLFLIGSKIFDVNTFLTFIIVVSLYNMVTALILYGPIFRLKDMKF